MINHGYDTHGLCALMLQRATGKQTRPPSLQIATATAMGLFSNTPFLEMGALRQSYTLFAI